MNLLSVQSAFQAGILQNDPGDLARRMSATSPDDADRRLGVYRHAYRATMTALLRDVFDKTWAYIGDVRFDATVAAYVADHRSTSFSLDDYGSGFPDLLTQRFADEPDVAELAWLDWSMRRAFDGPDAEPLTAQRLAVLSPDDWDRARLVLHPTLVVRDVRTNTGALWAGLDGGSPHMPGR